MKSGKLRPECPNVFKSSEFLSKLSDHTDVLNRILNVMRWEKCNFRYSEVRLLILIVGLQGKVRLDEYV